MNYRLPLMGLGARVDSSSVNWAPVLSHDGLISTSGICNKHYSLYIFKYLLMAELALFGYA
jgi:hypothetical protein